MRRSFYQGPGPTRFWWEHEHQPLAPAKREQPAEGSTDRRMQTCFHEASHAAAYVSHGIEVIDLVSMRTAAHPDWLGFCRTRGPVAPDVNVVCILAGQASDRIFFGLDPDMSSADAIAARAEAGKINAGNPKAVLDRAWNDALRLVGYHRVAIEKVAKALHFHGGLPPADLNQMLRGTTVKPVNCGEHASAATPCRRRVRDRTRHRSGRGCVCRDPGRCLALWKRKCAFRSPCHDRRASPHEGWSVAP